MENFTPGFSTWSGSPCPYFSHTIGKPCRGVWA
nr:MAG TPA: hypothetical protein [Caudoviricetes sp.]